MELPMAVAIAVLFAAGTYMILRPNLIRLVMGFGLYSNATNLLLITIGGYTQNERRPVRRQGPEIRPGTDGSAASGHHPDRHRHQLRRRAP